VGDGAHPGRRLHPALVAAVLAVAVGLAGLWYGHGAESTAAGGGPSQAVGPATGGSAAAGGATGSGAAASAGGSATVGDITVRGGYLREPASPSVAAGYLTITDTGSRPDTLLSAYCGAARSTALHDIPAAGSIPSPGGGGDPDRHVPSGSVTIGAGATLTLSPGHGHLMLTGLTGALRPGDSVSLLLTFQRAGQVLVELPVVAIGAPAPDGSRR
jgi:hypothetical protein